MKTSLLRYFNALLFLGSIFPFILACQSDTSQNSLSENTPSATESETEASEPNANNPATSEQPKSYQAGSILFSWVDQLNIRNKPGMDSKVITTVDSDAALEFTGEQSDESETLVLRSVAYNEPWLKVITPDKKKGWVFGGAVKQKEEEKGNSIITKTNFDFPYFGKYDLSKWTKLSTIVGNEEENVITTTLFQKEEQLLEFTDFGQTEYGYSYRYKLINSDRKVLKRRTFSFDANSDFNEITEAVKDYSVSPMKQYKRKQKLDKHFIHLNAKPLMARGDWTESLLKGTAPTYISNN